MTDPFAILVDFKLVSAQAMPAFRQLIDDNAQASCRDEPGCWRFDVLTVVGQGDRVILYEIYASKDAFDLHLKSPHFDHFNRASAPLVLNKAITVMSLVCEGTGPSPSSLMKDALI
jgi:quinol monooxygenase YgiN